MQIVQTPQGRVVQIIKDYTKIDDTDPTQADLIQITPVSFLVLRFPLSNIVVHVSPIRQNMREHRRLDYFSSLLAINQ